MYKRLPLFFLCLTLMIAIVTPISLTLAEGEEQSGDDLTSDLILFINVTGGTAEFEIKINTEDPRVDDVLANIDSMLNDVDHLDSEIASVENDNSHLWGSIRATWQNLRWLSDELGETNYALNLTIHRLVSTTNALNKTVGYLKNTQQALIQTRKVLYDANVKIGNLTVWLNSTSMTLEGLEHYTTEEIPKIHEGINKLNDNLRTLAQMYQALELRVSDLEEKQDVLEEKHNILLRHVTERDQLYTIGFFVCFALLAGIFIAESWLVKISREPK